MMEGRRTKKERRTERKKEFRGKGRRKKKSSAGIKPIWLILLVFLSVKRVWVDGGIGFTFLPSWATLFTVVHPPVQFPRVLLLPPRPLVHQVCCPWVAPIRGNSHSTFLLFGVLDARGSWCCYGVVQPPTGSSLWHAVSCSPAAPLCCVFCLSPREPVGPAGLCEQG